jgi:hypothetical protein
MDVTCLAKGWLEAAVNERQRRGDPPHPPYQIVMSYGRTYRNQELPRGLRKRAKKKCYLNSAVLVLDSEDGELKRYSGLDTARYERSLVYVEGYANSGQGIGCVEHAWAADREGNVIDLTWPYDATRAYFGVPFQSRYLRRVMKSGYMIALLSLPAGLQELYTRPPSDWLHAAAGFVTPD